MPIKDHEWASWHDARGYEPPMVVPHYRAITVDEFDRMTWGEALIACQAEQPLDEHDMAVMLVFRCGNEWGTAIATLDGHEVTLDPFSHRKPANGSNPHDWFAGPAKIMGFPTADHVRHAAEFFRGAITGNRFGFALEFPGTTQDDRFDHSEVEYQSGELTHFGWIIGTESDERRRLDTEAKNERARQECAIQAEAERVARLAEEAREQAALDADLKLIEELNAPRITDWIDPKNPDPNLFQIPGIDEVRAIIRAN